MKTQIKFRHAAGLVSAGAATLIFLFSFKALDREVRYAPADCTLRFTVDGGQYHHQQISVKGNPAIVSTGVYSGTYTKVAFSDRVSASAKETVGFELSVEGTKPTTQHVGDKIKSELDSKVHFLLHITEQGQLRFFMADYDEPAKVTPGTLTITKYGAVGENVEGTFSGKLINEVNEKQIILTITDGHFSVKRKS